MTVAEELSIGKAAKRSFVTQQCVSDHIRRMEEEYGVALFNRKPALSLTEAGEVMYQFLRSVQVLENNMEHTLKEISDGTKGSFTVGLSTSRAQVILPLALKKYYEHFPNVEVSFYINDTVVLEQALMDGSVDLILGVNASRNPSFFHNACSHGQHAAHYQRQSVPAAFREPPASRILRWRGPFGIFPGPVFPLL